MSKINLFDDQLELHKNILPIDGAAFYYGKIFNQKLANYYFDILNQTIEWKNDEIIMFGKRIITKRKVAWYADNMLEYRYSKITKKPSDWTNILLELRQIIQEHTHQQYNSCLANLYQDGSQGMGWHSDDEKALKLHAPIASLSLGADRKFVFKHKISKQNVSITLEHGSLLIMKNTTQTHWLHKLATTTRISNPRINLTFRTMML